MAKKHLKTSQIILYEELELKSAVILPIGYRAENEDWLVNLKKVRVPKEEFVIEIA